MSGSVVYLFADTNLLIQCRPLEELDWSAWNEFDEVRLIVSSPVLREIDYRKNKGSDRIGSRARVASAMFRKIMNDEYKLVHRSAPCVKLSVEPQHTFSKALENRLNYQERDDQLIGTVYEFAESNSGFDVRLLTHDTTPLYTAKSLHLATEVIPDEWLLPPESTEAEKELKRLRSELARLKQAEPSFAFRCLNDDGAEVKCYETTYTWFDPVIDAEIESFIQRLKDRFPLKTDFGSGEPTEPEATAFGLRIPGSKEEYVPAPEEEIAKYRDVTYPQWLEQCESTLRNLHLVLQREMPTQIFAFLVENRGTRPAAAALITLEARGNFEIKPPDQDDHHENENENDEHEGQAADSAVRLTRPPIAPRGTWRPTSVGSSRSVLSSLKMLNRSITSLPGMTGLQQILTRPYRPLPHTLYSPPLPRDPNEFYYKPNRSLIPQKAFSLECDQWRHEDGEVTFDGEILFSPDQDEIEGALVCRIQAVNLSQRTSKLIPVRIAISHTSAYDRANELVDALIGHPEPQIRSVLGQSDTSSTEL